MRKRSGAIHCESEEEFIRLSILSDKKLGIFYESSESPSPRPQSSKGFSQGSQLWEQFDYDKNRQPELDQCSIEQQAIQTLNVMVLYDEECGLRELVAKAVRSLAGCPDDPETQEQSMGPLDLVIRQEHLADRKLIIKFWVSPDISSPLIKSYHDRTDAFLNIHLSGPNRQCEKPLTKPQSSKQHLLSFSLQLETRDCSRQISAFLEQVLIVFIQKLESIRELANRIHASA